MILKRSYDPEILDDFSIQDERIDSALKELNIINSLLGGNRISRKGIKMFHAKLNTLTILDVGAGASDILLEIKRKFKNLNIYGLDMNHRTCLFLKKYSTDVKVICGDVLNLPFDSAFDIIHASLFLHHFIEEEIKRIIISLLKLCNKGIVINDLRRSIFAWMGIKILTSLFSRSKEVKYDGPLSVKRGFIKKDWTDILNNICPGRYKIKRMWAFRWLIVIYK
jgi:2-polyprenyl-3-methyl-5-hydroxy-6-metoxy-1,4-benzoquinol methylase